MSDVDGGIKTAVMTALAASTMHGVSHAAGNRGTPLRVMWALLFLLFLSLFLFNSSNLVQKLSSRALAKSYELDKVMFEFPDLYFCPSNPYSGSFPYNLTQEEADRVNGAIAQVIATCKESSFCSRLIEMVATWPPFVVQYSLPMRMITDYLTQRQTQSGIGAALISSNTSGSSGVELEHFSHPENMVCFKTVLKKQQREQLRYQGSVLIVYLSTDPYFPDFNLTGSPILDIDIANGGTVKFRDWHLQRGWDTLKSSGYTMVVVPPGVYPAMEYEHSIQLAPGNAYKVKLHMEDHLCTDELQGSHCDVKHPTVTLRDPLTHKRVKFKYSRASCIQHEMQRQFIGALGCQLSTYPTQWKHRGIPRCFNMTEMTNGSFDRFIMGMIERDALTDESLLATQACTNRIPCNYASYSSRFSFDKWPSSGSAAEGIANSPIFDMSDMETEDAPAQAQLLSVARQLKNGSHSAHLEGIFRSYIAESLLTVTISGASILSPQVTMAWSYSFTAFLADSGGLLGLYIGCSVMSVFELLEVIWSICSIYRCRRCRRDQSGAPAAAADDAPGPAGAGQDGEEAAVAAVEAGQNKPVELEDLKA